jgi:hypothetical protein
MHILMLLLCPHKMCAGYRYDGHYQDYWLPIDSCSDAACDAACKKLDPKKSDKCVGGVCFHCE